MTTVVVPVFNAPEETQACLQSLATHTDPSTSIIIVNDASDDPLIKTVLKERPSAWTLIENERNIGFVGSANLGMVLAGGDDVVLLNADTEVTPNWLVTLEQCLEADAKIASVSPLTNHGEIASVPIFCQPNAFPQDKEAWAQACFDSASEDHPWDLFEVPTTIGFCMLIRRSALNAIGYFDESAFGRGYGEENDWCQRAIQAGWRHVICDRAFVAHRGGASFGPLGLFPGGEAMQILLQRYPNYADAVAEFIAKDPMAERRSAIVEYYHQTQHNSIQ